MAFSQMDTKNPAAFNDANNNNK